MAIVCYYPRDAQAMICFAIMRIEEKSFSAACIVYVKIERVNFFFSVVTKIYKEIEMSRKDTIIIAVLINAGLLIVLFASALKTSPPQPEYSESSLVRYAEPAVKKETPVQRIDEVDQALANASTAPVTIQSTSTPSPALSTLPQSLNFAEDLKAFAVPSKPAVPSFSEEKKSSEYAEIKVKKGDVLEKIARQHRTTVEEIISVNKLSNTNLRIGQTLKIPHKNLAPAATASAIPAKAAEPKYYIVKNGDNPWTIAVKNHMKLEELLKLNNLDQEKARKLKPGDKLLIR